MKLKFKRETEVEVVDELQKGVDVIYTTSKIFKKGAKVEGKIIADNSGFIDIEFKDGTIGLGIHEDSYEKVKAA